MTPNMRATATLYSLVLMRYERQVPEPARADFTKENVRSSILIPTKMQNKIIKEGENGKMTWVAEWAQVQVELIRCPNLMLGKYSRNSAQVLFPPQERVPLLTSTHTGEIPRRFLPFAHTSSDCEKTRNIRSES
ncbi:1263_t:CDS:2, partial [Acaulospora colombiana]